MTRDRGDSMSADGDLDESEENQSIAVMMAKMSKDLARLTKNFSGIQREIRETVADSIAAKIDANTKRMDEMEKKQKKDLDEMRKGVDIQVHNFLQDTLCNMEEMKTPVTDRNPRNKSNTQTYAGKASMPTGCADTSRVLPASPVKTHTKNDEWYCMEVEKMPQIFPNCRGKQRTTLASSGRFCTK